jgi:hypothetical protein
VANGEDRPDSSPIILGTSPGYPYCLNAKKGKAPYMFMDENQRRQYDPQFLQKLIEYDETLRAGGDIEVVWADFLKDETRPIEKVNEGKTRLVSSSPLHFTCLMRKYFLSFVTYVQSMASQKPVAVGINVHSLEWTELFCRLNRTAESVLSGDFSNYDGKLPASLTKPFTDFVNWWYDDGPINARVRHLLMKHISHAVHLCGNKLYQVVDGNPSGNPITSIYNSFCNYMMTYIVLTEDLGLSDDEFEMTIYGDDIVVTINRVGIRCEHLTPHFKRRFDMDYTHFSKKENHDDDTMFTINFIGRKFVERQNIYSAPLELRTILEIPYWIKGDVDPQLAALSAAESLGRELSHLSEEEYKYYWGRFVNASLVRQPHAAHYIIYRAKTWYMHRQSMYHLKEEIWFDPDKPRTDLYDTKEVDDWTESTIRGEPTSLPECMKLEV